MSDTPTYNDDDLVYVDPDAKAVVGKVEFKENGLPIPKEMPSKFAEPDAPTAPDTTEADAKPEPAAKPAPGGRGGKPDRRPPRKPRKRYYPWGTYKTMKKIYKIEGKIPEAERTRTLDDVMEKALQEPYWD